MSQKKEFKAKVHKSYCIDLPASVINELQLRDNDSVVFVLSNNGQVYLQKHEE